LYTGTAFDGRRYWTAIHAPEAMKSTATTSNNHSIRRWRFWLMGFAWISSGNLTGVKIRGRFGRMSVSSAGKLVSAGVDSGSRFGSG
jgi:hypothetical protein